MKTIPEGTYLTVGEVAKKIGRGIRTVKNWYEWLYDQPSAVQSSGILPSVNTWLDKKGTWYFLQQDVPKLIEFRDGIQYGQLATTNRKKWGKRGQHAQEDPIVPLAEKV